MSKFTPGVWRYTACDETAIDNVSTVSTGECYIAVSMNEPDGLLIAAAPDLLEALEALMSECCMAEWAPASEPVSYQKCKAAVLKARGGQK